MWVRFPPPALDSGRFSTFAGQCGDPCFEGDDGSTEYAKLFLYYDIYFDSAGNFYIVDTHNHRVRVVLK